MTNEKEWGTIVFTSRTITWQSMEAANTIIVNNEFEQAKERSANKNPIDLT